MPERPNILFILTDQQARATLGAYGNPHVRTPHLDSLAAGGISFMHSYCTSPVCSPARASLVTGRMPHEVGVDFNDLPIAPGIPGMGDIFRAAGYETVWTGKWNLPDSYPRGADPIPGFHYLDSGRESFATRIDRRVAHSAVEFIAGEHERPFLLAVSLLNPHDICHWIMDSAAPLEALLGVAPGNRFLPPLPPNFAMDPAEPEFIATCRQRAAYGPELLWTKHWNEQQWRTYLYIYHRFVEQIDARVGSVLAALQESGLDESTLVVFTSDHGEGMAAHRWAAKLMLYEESVTVPLLLRWTGHLPANVRDETHLASGLDLLPTLADYAGVPLPSGVRGTSLRPAIEQPHLPGADFVVSELQPDPERTEMRGRMVRTGRYKYVAFSEGSNPELLFDLQTDPLETRNLASQPTMQDELTRHRAVLRRWIEQTGDPFEGPV